MLSEYAALGFEYGYSVADAGAFVAWEAQFGDFANGAQIVIDQYIVAAEDKWGSGRASRCSSRTGSRGQGPEHSSARIERFLALCAIATFASRTRRPRRSTSTCSAVKP